MVEAKHYKKTTALDARKLISEIDEAIESDPHLDIWILATSRMVDEQIATSLEKKAESVGIDVFILDMGINGLTRMALLMAAFSSVTIQWITQNQPTFDTDELESAFQAIRERPDFVSSKTRQLERLDSTTGYGTTRGRIEQRLLLTLSDRNNARAAFGQYLDIKGPCTQVIPRTELNDALNRWWGAEGTLSPAVVLGEEGTGKTWAHLRLDCTQNGRWRDANCIAASRCLPTTH